MNWFIELMHNNIAVAILYSLSTGVFLLLFWLILLRYLRRCTKEYLILTLATAVHFFMMIAFSLHRYFHIAELRSVWRLGMVILVILAIVFLWLNRREFFCYHNGNNHD